MSQMEAIVAGSLMGSPLSETPGRGEALVWPIIKDELLDLFGR